MSLRIDLSTVKARKLSYKKIQLQYKLDIIAHDDVIGSIDMKFRYNVDVDHNATLIPVKEVMYNMMSMKYAIKKKHIGIHCHSTKYGLQLPLDILIEDTHYKIDRLPDSVHFSPSDMSWYRDWKIKKLFAN